jgi:hypothetical protein
MIWPEQISVRQPVPDVPRSCVPPDASRQPIPISPNPSLQLRLNNNRGGATLPTVRVEILLDPSLDLTPMESFLAASIAVAEGDSKAEAPRLRSKQFVASLKNTVVTIVMTDYFEGNLSEPRSIDLERSTSRLSLAS